MSEKACRKCNLISNGTICPSCKATGLSDDFSGMVIIFEPDNSLIANGMGVKKRGRYAIRVR
jgi:DNA-directed RNA polymerase subunit E"